jgi:ketosteroid isomerase-like protein
MSADPALALRDVVLATNERFYAAFSQRDFPAMSELWHPTLPVVCIHPGWPPLEGRADVLQSWRRILENPSAPPIRCVRPSVHIMHDVALVVCFEAIGRNRLVATNGFARNDDEWHLVFHQAGPVASDDDEEDERDVEPSRGNRELN